MGYRRTRTAPTAPRRVHATDEEWSRVRAAARTADMSISALVIDRVLDRREGPPRGDTARAIRLLTASHVTLSEIVDRIDEREPDLEALPLAAAMDRVAHLLDEIAGSLGTTSTGKGGSG